MSETTARITKVHRGPPERIEYDVALVNDKGQILPFATVNTSEDQARAFIAKRWPKIKVEFVEVGGEA